MKYIVGIYLIILFFACSADRSIQRPKDPLMPEIQTRWIGDEKYYYLKDYHLEHEALFTKFDKQHVLSHLLPDKAITLRRNPKKKVKGKHLKKLAQELLQEIYQRKRDYTHFKVLKSQDFNKRTLSGVLILKYKKYDFVLKVFIKTPETFVKPLSEGWIQGCFFIMGGGINRYLSGFTRVKNLEIVEKNIKQDPYWSTCLEVVRKWFILPENVRWFELSGKNIGPLGEYSVLLPSVYFIIADYIHAKKVLKLSNKKDRELGLKLSHFLGNRIDAHIDNFMIEKDTNKIVLIDSEHFPTMVGLKDPLNYSSYSSWYAKLTLKFLQDKFCRSKYYRRRLQSHPRPVILPCNG